MRISNSKKQLARIINENGGWRDGAKFAAQGGNHGHVGFASVAPVRNGKVWDMTRGFAGKFLADEILPNWHQTILSREEYFHLYPAPVKVVVVAENKTTCHLTVTDKPTIEQLATDYRNRKDYADSKQQEADAAKADAEVKLAELVAAGKALGLVLSIAGVEPESELVITDWRDLRVGDRIWVGDSGRSRNCPEGEYEIAAIDRRDSDQPVGLAWPGGLTGVTWPKIHKRGWRFIRRPAKGGANA